MFSPLPTQATWTAVVVAALAAAPAWARAEAPLCKLGRRQSPVDIVAPLKADLPKLAFNYRAVPLKLANDGHTVRVRLAGAGELVIGKERYRLDQFHFHTPGGDRIGGEEFPMAAHVLHKSRSGQLLAIVVLFRRGAVNPALTALWAQLPPTVDGDHVVKNAVADAGQLIPKDHAYYRYEGSLTASPCTEGVVWLVMKQPLELSDEQLAYWRARFADNIRAPQPLNGRGVQVGG